MVGPGLGDQLIAQRLAALALHQLLQLRLAVAEDQPVPRVQRGEDVPLDKSARHLQPAVEVHGGDQRLHRVGEDGRPLPPAGVLLAAPQADVVPQAQLGGHAPEAVLADELGADARHAPLGQLRFAAVERVRHHEAEHRVAQKLQPLVALAAVAAVLVGIRAVREGIHQQLLVAEGIIKFFLYGLHQAVAPST